MNNYHSYSNAMEDENKGYALLATESIALHEYISPMYEKELHIKIGKHDLSNITFYFFTLKTSTEDGKRVENTYLTAHECDFACKRSNQFRSDYYAKKPYLCPFQTIHNASSILCPHITNVIQIKKPKKHSPFYKDFQSLKMVLHYRNYFGKFTFWIIDNYDKLSTCGNIPADLFKDLKEYPEFSLENVIASCSKRKSMENIFSIDYFKSKIEEDKSYTGFRKLSDSIKESWEKKLIDAYIEELEQYRDGLLMRCFNSKEENEYLKWKETYKVKVLKFGNTFSIYEPIFSIPNNSFLSTRTKNGKYVSALNFEEEHIDEAIQAFSSERIFYGGFVTRLVIETLEEYKATGKLPVFEENFFT